MRIVLFGKNGQVGWELNRVLPLLGEVIAVDYQDFDIGDLKILQDKLIELKPDIIVNASAYTAVDKAETEQDAAEKVNNLAPGVMAEASRGLGALLIHYSTDYVFDGEKGSPYTEADAPNPLSVYGKSKLAGERAIEQAGGIYLILRTAWVYSLHGDSYVRKVLRWARTNPTLKVVSDQISNPTWARSLAEMTGLLLAQAGAEYTEYFRQKRGIYHLAGGGYTSRFAWAQEILELDPKPDEHIIQSVQPAATSDFPTPAQRPLFSALDCARFKSTFSLSLPGWQQSLQLAME